jgi:hypothetical protein
MQPGNFFVAYNVKNKTKNTDKPGVAKSTTPHPGVPGRPGQLFYPTRQDNALQDRGTERAW